MIKRAAATKIAESQQKMQSYVTMTEFHYSQICIKHEIGSLIPIGIDYEGETKKLEDMADTFFPEGEDDFDKIYVLPKDNLYIKAIIEGIYNVHPEFKIEIFSEGADNDEEGKTGKEERMGSGFSQKEDTDEVMSKDEDEMEDNDSKYYYIRLTMPPVNKKRRDFCHEQVKQIFEYTKVKLDKEKVLMKANVAPKTIGYTDKELDEVNKAMDKVYDDCMKQAEEMRNEKDDEIEMAYNKFVDIYGEEVESTDDETSASEPKQEGNAPAETSSNSGSVFRNDSQPEDDGGNDEPSMSMKL